MHKTFMAVLLSSISVASAAAIAQSATGDVPAWAAEAQMNPDYAPAPAAKEATDPAASETLQDSSSAPAAAPAWAAEATMNPDYVAEKPSPTEPAAAADAGATPAAAPAWAAEATMNPEYVAEKPSQTEPAVAADAVTTPAATPAWAAEATMNPDYRSETPAAPEAGETTAEPAAEPTAPAAPAATAAEPAVEQPASAEVAAPTPSEPGVTQYFGTSDSTGSPAWAADAKMNPDYVAAPPATAPAPAVAAPPATAPAPAAATPTATQDEVSPERQQQVEACRDALNGELQTARLMFGSGKWDILPVSYGGLDRIAKIAKDCGDVVIEVDGHTDNTGKPDSNVTISVLRAEAVVKYLVRAGVDAANLRAVGHGGTKPIASNDTAEGRRKNRRIEFIVWDRGHPPS